MKEINDSLLNKAIRNFNIAKMIYSDGEMADEMYLNNVGYNLEQAVELAIKHVMELSGCQYPKTHDIEQLIRIAEEEGVDLFLNDFIDSNSGTITQWEASTRHVKDYLATRRRIETGLKEIGKYLELIAAKERERYAGQPSQ